MLVRNTAAYIVQQATKILKQRLAAGEEFIRSIYSLHPSRTASLCCRVGIRAQHIFTLSPSKLTDSKPNSRDCWISKSKSKYIQMRVYVLHVKAIHTDQKIHADQDIDYKHDTKLGETPKC